MVIVAQLVELNGTARLGVRGRGFESRRLPQITEVER